MIFESEPMSSNFVFWNKHIYIIHYISITLDIYDKD